MTLCVHQLYRGTKYSQFPNWLDQWMRMRKRFGHLMLMSASVHACSYLLLFQLKKTTVEVPIWEHDENGTMVRCSFLLLRMDSNSSIKKLLGIKLQP